MIATNFSSFGAGPMADRTSLRILGFIFGAVTTATILIGFVVVLDIALPVDDTPVASISTTTR